MALCFHKESLGFCKHDRLTFAWGQTLCLQHGDLQAGALLLQGVLDHDALRQGVRRIVRLAGLLQQVGTRTCGTVAPCAIRCAARRTDDVSFHVGCPGTYTELADSVQDCLQLSQQQVCGNPLPWRHKTGAKVGMLYIAGDQGLLHLPQSDQACLDTHLMGPLKQTGLGLDMQDPLRRPTQCGWLEGSSCSYFSPHSLAAAQPQIVCQHLTLLCSPGLSRATF